MAWERTTCKDCEWIDHRAFGRSCSARSREGYKCTREPGHDGPHRACGLDKDEHPIAEWDNGPDGV